MYHALALMKISSAKQLLNNLKIIVLKPPFSVALFFIFLKKLQIIKSNLSKAGFIMIFIKAFVVGGLICVIGQILLDKTKLTAGRILVLYVVAGVFLGAIGLFEPLEKFAECGATVPLLGFGAALVKGTKEIIDTDGAMGIITGPLTSGAGGITAALLSGFVMSLIAKPKSK